MNSWFNYGYAFSDEFSECWSSQLFLKYRYGLGLGGGGRASHFIDLDESGAVDAAKREMLAPLRPRPVVGPKFPGVL